jgi:hypothetical protein
MILLSLQLELMYTLRVVQLWQRTVKLGIEAVISKMSSEDLFHMFITHSLLEHAPQFKESSILLETKGTRY